MPYATACRPFVCLHAHIVSKAAHTYEVLTLQGLHRYITRTYRIYLESRCTGESRTFLSPWTSSTYSGPDPTTMRSCYTAPQVHDGTACDHCCPVVARCAGHALRAERGETRVIGRYQDGLTLHRCWVRRQPDDVPQHIDDIVAAKPAAVWLQSGIRNPEAEEAFAKAGMKVCQAKAAFPLFTRQSRVWLKKYSSSAHSS